MHNAHQGGPTSSKAFFLITLCIHKKELAGNALPIQSSYAYTRPTKEAQQALKLFLKIHPCSQERVSRQCPYHSELLYIHKHHQGGPTSSKAIFKNPPLHSQERFSRQCL